MNEKKKIEKKILKQIGVIDNSHQIWVEGMYYSSIDMDLNEISERIPIFGIMEQIHEGKKVKELLLLYADNQSSIVVLNNMQLDDNLTTIGAFATGSEDLLNESRFQAIRLGSYTEMGFDPSVPRFRTKLQSLVKEAEEEEIKCFLDNTDFNFLRWFYTRNFNELMVILPNIYEKLCEFSNFNHELFLQRISEIGEKISSEMLSSLLQEFQEIKTIKDDTLGYVIESKGDKISIITIKKLNPIESPLVVAKLNEGDRFILLINSFSGDHVESTILYSINAKNEPIGGIFNVPKGTPIIPVSWADIDCTLIASTSTRVDPIYLPIGRIIGVKEMAGNKFIEINEDIGLKHQIKERSSGKKIEIQGEFKIAITPGELSNGIFIGDSGAGKTNCLLILAISAAYNNRYNVGNKVSLLLFDKEGEYYAIFKQIKKHEEYSKHFQILDVVMDHEAKFPIKDIPLHYFCSKKYDLILSNLLRELNNMGDISKSPMIGRENRMTVGSLNYFLNNNISSRMGELNELSFNSSQIQAIIRRIKKNIIILEPILQIQEKSDGEYEDITDSKKSAYQILDDVQRNGKILVLNMQRFTNSESYTIYSNLITNKLQYLRQQWFEKELDKNRGNILAFTKSAPVLLIINEEATNLFAIMDKPKIQSHIRSATGARKFNMGTIYIFQTLQGIESSIGLILSQLGGFNFIFAVTSERSLKTTLRNINIRSADSLKDFIKNSKGFKYCVASGEAYDRRPYFIQSYRASDYFEAIFGIEMIQKSEEEREFDLEKEKRANEPKTLSSRDIEEKSVLDEDF